jgi:hypothetical protein
VGMLLLTQWLVAAYACPPQRHAQAPVQAHAGCDSADHGPDAVPAYPALCKAHCSADSQLPAQPDGAGDTAEPSTGWFIVSQQPAPRVAQAEAAWPQLPRAGAPPGWPPLFLIHQVLRN